MPNQVSESGLQVNTLQEILDSLTASLKLTYGTDINLAQSSPDGQLLNIFAQAAKDILDFATMVYASFGIDTAFGSSLDRLMALAGLARLAGTFTYVNISVTVDRALTLAGLDTAALDPAGTGFTVQDGSGNQFILVTTNVFSGAGTSSLLFRAKNVGAVQVAANTITNVVTVTLGVTVVNNPAGPTTLGTDEESDADFRTRHAKSLQLGSSGTADAVEAALLATPGVIDAFVPQNDTAGTVNGVLARSIWAIVDGGADADVANAIYTKKSLGCNMTGGTTFGITRPDGTTFSAKFDRPQFDLLYIRFSLIARTGTVVFDNTSIIAALASALSYKLNQQATVGDVFAALETIVPQGIPTSLQISKDNSNWFDVLQPTDYRHKFAVAIARISII